MWQTERPSHEIRCDQRTRWFEQLCVRSKGFNIDVHRWNPYCLDGTSYVTHGHMTDGSTCCQEDRIHPIVLEHLRPLGCDFLHQARNIGESVIGIVAFSQGTNGSFVSKLAKA